MNYIEGRSYVIAGGAIGLGYEAAKELAKLGGNILVGDINEEKAQETAKELEDMGVKAFAQKCDVTSSADAISLMQRAVKEFGRIDGMIDTAGVMPLGEFVKSPVEKWTRGVEININGVLNTTHAAIEEMLKQEGRIPHIIAYASTAARFPSPGAGVYSATKIAIRYIMDSLRREFAGKIKFTTFYPGPTAGTALRTSQGIVEGDRFFGKAASPFDPEAAIRVMKDPNLDQPLPFGKPIIIAQETVHVLNQPEGAYLTDVWCTYSNDRS